VRRKSTPVHGADGADALQGIGQQWPSGRRNDYFEDDDNDEFQWDYSYFKWQDIPREVRREMVLARSWAARTWIYGKTAYQMDVPFAAARELYNKNWDGCRDLWKELYRAKKHLGSAPQCAIHRTK
jgi:hypothetical protein